MNTTRSCKQNCDCIFALRSEGKSSKAVKSNILHRIRAKSCKRVQVHKIFHLRSTAVVIIDMQYAALIGNSETATDRLLDSHENLAVLRDLLDVTIYTLKQVN